MIIDLCVARACALVGPGLATPLIGGYGSGKRILQPIKNVRAHAHYSRKWRQYIAKYSGFFYCFRYIL